MAGAILTVIAACGGSIGSVGAVMGQDRQSGRVVVHQAPPGLAAARAGLKPGDEILAIEGRDVRGLTVEEIQEALRGEVGTKVHLTVAHADGRVERMTVVRGPFRVDSGE